MINVAKAIAELEAMKDDDVVVPKQQYAELLSEVALGKRVGETTRRIEREGRASIRRHAGSIIRTFGQVEAAGAELFGGRSITSGITSRLGGITNAARAAGTGLGEAAASGGMLSSAIGVVGVAASATVGILAAAAYGAFKLADGWAKGAASMGRMAETIGVGSRELQEFNAAAERVGVDKDKASGALGGLSQSLNDARYGRNNEALEVLRRLGVGMKTKADGTVDVGAMLPAIADAIARQNSSGRRTAARHLGIDLSALPIFTQGGKALSATVILGAGVSGVSVSGVAAEAITGGADIETDEDLRSRMLAAYASPARGGARGDYADWALAVPGVTRAWVVPAGRGAGTVVVYFMLDVVNASSGGFPRGLSGCAAAETRDSSATGDQLAVADAIFPRQPVTALVYAVAPTSNDVQLTIAGLATSTIAVRNAITAAVKAAMAREGVPGGILRLSTIERAIAAVPGAEGFIITGITAAAGTIAPAGVGNITSAAGALPTLAGITYA